jgi:hypothetical protein
VETLAEIILALVGIRLVRGYMDAGWPGVKRATRTLVIGA